MIFITSDRFVWRTGRGRVLWRDLHEFTKEGKFPDSFYIRSSKTSNVIQVYRGRSHRYNDDVRFWIYEGAINDTRITVHVFDNSLNKEMTLPDD